MIDTDNVSATHASAVLEELATYGTPTINRAYGDWTTPKLSGWKKELTYRAIQPIQQFAYTTRRIVPQPAADSQGQQLSQKPAASEEDDAPRINLQSALTKAVHATSGDDGWASLSLLGQYLNRTHADFDPRVHSARFEPDSTIEANHRAVQHRVLQDLTHSCRIIFWLTQPRRMQSLLRQRIASFIR